MTPGNRAPWTVLLLTLALAILAVVMVAYKPF